MSHESRVKSQGVYAVILAKVGIQFDCLSRVNQFVSHTSYLIPHTSVKSEILQ